MERTSLAEMPGRRKSVRILLPANTATCPPDGQGHDRSEESTHYCSFPFRPPSTPVLSRPLSLSSLASLDTFAANELSAVNATSSLSSRSPRTSRPPSILQDAAPRSRMLSIRQAAGKLMRRTSRLSASYDDATFISSYVAADQGSNGLRVWYQSYTTIDWIHDAIKDSSRRRAIDRMKGPRRLIAKAWDGAQAWIIVFLIGVLTALVAVAVIKSEAWMFDFKDGYCSTDWRRPKRLCCPHGGNQDWDRDPIVSLTTESSRILSATSFGLGSQSPTAVVETADCPGWVRWSDALKMSARNSGAINFFVYTLIAVLYTSLACILTLRLTASNLFEAERGGPPAGNIGDTARPSSAGDDEGGHHASPAQSKRSTERTALKSQQSRHRAYGTSCFDSHSATSVTAESAGAYRAEQAVASRKILYFGSGSGISEVKAILSGFVIHGFLGFRTLFAKSVGLALSVASGLSAGKEGPFVHIASCIGNLTARSTSKFDRNESKRREILSCACAAGVTVAFGAPVGGVLFSLEEASTYFSHKTMFRAFFCAGITAATLKLLNPYGTGQIVLFEVTYDKDWAFQELPIFAFLGLFGGLYGAAFTRLNMLWSKNVRAKTWMAKYPLGEVVLVTALTACLSYFNEYTRMGGPELIADLFSECHGQDTLDGLCISKTSEIGPLVASIGLALLVRGLLTIVTFGIKLPAGIFIPSLAVGACFGRIVGLLVQYTRWTHPELPIFSWCPASEPVCIIPGIYALVGAAATLAGVTRTTVSLAVIIFELTNSLTYSIPVMISVLIARTVADALERKGIYELVIELSGLPYLDPKSSFTWQDVSIGDVVDDHVEYIDVGQKNTVASLYKKLNRLAFGLGYADGGFPLVVKGTAEVPPTSEGVSGMSRGLRLVGYISAHELEYGLKEMKSNQPELNEADTVCTFASISNRAGSSTPLEDSTASLRADHGTSLSFYVDRAPITVTTLTPLELVQQYFLKLGVRYLIVLDTDGHLKGVIFKKRWLAFLSSLEGGQANK